MKTATKSVVVIEVWKWTKTSVLRATLSVSALRRKSRFFDRENLYSIIRRSDISLGNISKKKGKNILKLDFCKDTPIEPRKRVVRLVRPNFGTPGFGATFYAKKCYFWPFSPTSSVPNFIKTHSHLKNGNIYHSKKFWEIWCRESVKKWPKIAFFGPKTAIFGHFCMVGSIKLLGVVNIDSF